MIIILGFVIRIVYTFINTYYYKMPDASLDALTFHSSAVNFSNGKDYFMNTIGQGQIYVIMLGNIYKILPPNLEHFSGGVLSAIAWLFSAIVLFKLLQYNNLNSLNISLALLIYSFLPFSIIYTSITLREPFQLLLINLVFYFIILLFNKFKKDYVFGLLVVLSILYFFHKSFIFFIIFTITIISIVYVSRIFNYFEKQRLIILIFFISIFFIVIPYYTEVYTIIENQITNFKFNQIQYARTIYKDNFQTSLESEYFLISLLYNFIQFEFEPFPWREVTFLDYILIVQNIFKLFVFYIIIKKFFLSFKAKSSTYVVIFLVFIFLEILWSTGTVNWGTAARHQVPGYGMLLFLTFANLKKLK